MIKSFIKLNKELWENRRIIFAMGKADFKNEYIGSALGIFWGVVKPFIMILVYTIVFTNQINGMPYYIWIIPGLFLWTFLSDSLVGGTNSIRGNSHLVKKVVFPISILPAVKIMGNLINHLIFMGIACVIIFASGIPITIGVLQIFYYMICSVIFTLAITRMLSAMAVMSIDVVHFITTIMQLLLWASPILWNASDTSRPMLQKVLPILKLNPYYYLIEGYRNSFFSPQIPFYADWKMMLWFWGVTIVIFLLGSYYYEKNRKNFADVL